MHPKTHLQAFWRSSDFDNSPYKMNDFILDDGQRGRVDSIGFRSTRLMTPDDVQVIIPNAIMANTKIINISVEEAIMQE